MLNSSYDDVTMTGYIPPANVGHGAVNGSASAYSIANTYNGALGVYDAGTSNSVSGYEEGGTGTSYAAAYDTLHFSVASAGVNTVTLIPVSYAITGSLSGVSNAAVGAQLNFGSGRFEEYASEGAPSFIPTVGAQTASNRSSYRITQNAPGSFTFTGLYSITGPTADLSVYEYLSGQAGGGGASQYSHTGVLSLGPGAGVTYTSDSGAFLTQAATTPEPGSLLLLLGGAAGLAMMRRAQR